MFSGYVITDTADEALSLVDSGITGVRYAARFDDGRGFAAFDSEEFGDGTMIVNGYLLVTVEPIPDYPPSWPHPKPGPKRQVAQGDERFVLYRVPTYETPYETLAMFVELYDPRAAGVVAADGTHYVLIETGPEWRCSFDPVWDATVVAYRDIRLEVLA